MWGVINYKRNIGDNEWLYTFFFFWIVVVVLSIIKLLNIFPNLV